MKLKRRMLALFGLAWWKVKPLGTGHEKNRKASRWFSWLRPGKREAIQMPLFEELHEDEAA